MAESAEKTLLKYKKKLLLILVFFLKKQIYTGRS